MQHRVITCLLVSIPLSASPTLSSGCPNRSLGECVIQATWCEDRWHWASPTPQGSDLVDVTYAETLSTFVAVGRAGAVITSRDGLTWSHLDVGLADHFNSVASGPGLFVAVGVRTRTYSPMFLSSCDGHEWKARDTADHAQVSGAVNTVAWDGAQFVALDDHGRVWKSSDGVHWPALGTPITGVPWFWPNELAWTGTEYVAAGFGKVAIPGETGGIVLTSADAVTWKLAFYEVGIRLNRVAYSPSVLVVVGDNGLIASRAGGAWTSERLEAYFTAAVWTGERFLATGSTPNEPQHLAYESPDGTTWTTVDIPALTEIHAFAGGGGGLVAVGEHGACASSSDGRTWRKIDIALSGSWQSVAWVGNSFVAVGDLGAVATSRDGVSWVEEEPPTTEHLHDVVWGGGRVLAIGNNGSTLLKSAGGAWAIEQSGTSIPLFSAVWDGSRFVVAGGDLESGYAVLASPDGVQWQRLSDEATPAIRWLEWTGRSFIGVGRGEIHSSSDAVHWAPIPIENAPCYHQLATVPTAAASSATLTVVMTQDALCDIPGACASRPLVSSDGADWQCGDGIPAAHSVAFNGTQFVAVGEGGTISSSSDGITWTSERGRGSASASLFGIAFSPSTTVVVGVEGTVMVKSCPRPSIPRRRLHHLETGGAGRTESR